MYPISPVPWGTAVLRCSSCWRWPASVNIFLDYFLILNVGMNVEGAAYAAIAAQLLSGVACLVYMLRRFPQMHLHGSDWKLTWDPVSHALALALPMGFQMSVIALGQIAVQFALDGGGLGLCSSLHRTLPED